ncbi:hypothetical protein [Cellvibrio sp. QJXJ]|uniref:hypothetical protein n=1 Tax=Cellvibrio sp. QJXJ TaxID=2964606 RepID=UPI0021C38384|nr:hypothetical protein [Cellvibrio sp. QJXJ]UUA75289.1 hypothetical protein NNX04_22805 [Cellvibrio sp. QJXJ]
MWRTKSDVASGCAAISNELQELATGIEQILSWFEKGEDPRVIAGSLEHHPHMLTMLAIRAKSISEDMAHQAAAEVTDAALNRIFVLDDTKGD